MSFFVSPERERLPIAGDQWIEVKQRLGVGDQKRMQSAAFGNLKPTGDGTNSIEVDWTRYGLARVEAYLVDWSLKDADGKAVPVSRAAIEALTPAIFEQIDQAIDGYLTQQDQEKKDSSTSRRGRSRGTSLPH